MNVSQLFRVIVHNSCFLCLPLTTNICAVDVLRVAVSSISIDLLQVWDPGFTVQMHSDQRPGIMLPRRRRERGRIVTRCERNAPTLQACLGLWQGLRPLAASQTSGPLMMRGKSRVGERIGRRCGILCLENLVSKIFHLAGHWLSLTCGPRIFLSNLEEDAIKDDM